MFFLGVHIFNHPNPELHKSWGVQQGAHIKNEVHMTSETHELQDTLVHIIITLGGPSTYYNSYILYL
jgi:hypothetical protein